MPLMVFTALAAFFLIIFLLPEYIIAPATPAAIPTAMPVPIPLTKQFVPLFMIISPLLS
jgi:hypothetical protein